MHHLGAAPTPKEQQRQYTPRLHTPSSPDVVVQQLMAHAVAVSCSSSSPWNPQIPDSPPSQNFPSRARAFSAIRIRAARWRAGSLGRHDAVGLCKRTEKEGAAVSTRRARCGVWCGGGRPSLRVWNAVAGGRIGGVMGEVPRGVVARRLGLRCGHASREKGGRTGREGGEAGHARQGDEPM